MEQIKTPIEVKITVREKMNILVASLSEAVSRSNEIHGKQRFPIGEFQNAYLSGNEALWVSMCKKLLVGTKYEDKFLKSNDTTAGEDLKRKKGEDCDDEEDDDGDDY